MTQENIQFLIEDKISAVRHRCFMAIDKLGWRVRRDLTSDNDISFYVPIPEYLPNAPIYFITLYPDSGQTYLVIGASTDDLSQSFANQHLPILKEAILTGEVPDSPPSKPTAAPQADSHPAQCFISYRRYDSADVVGRIYDRLSARYGDATIFKDVDNIPIGVDFRKVIEEAVSRCVVMLVVIGRDWIDLVDEQGQRRIEDPRDFVRLEIEAALQRDIPIIPLVVRNGSMPKAEELPPSIQDLAFRNGLEIRSDPDFNQDIEKLYDYLDHLSL